MLPDLDQVELVIDPQAGTGMAYFWRADGTEAMLSFAIPAVTDWAATVDRAFESAPANLLSLNLEFTGKSHG